MDRQLETQRQRRKKIEKRGRVRGRQTTETERNSE